MLLNNDIAAARASLRRWVALGTSFGELRRGRVDRAGGVTDPQCCQPASTSPPPNGKRKPGSARPEFGLSNHAKRSARRSVVNVLAWKPQHRRAVRHGPTGWFNVGSSTPDCGAEMYLALARRDLLARPAAPQAPWSARQRRAFRPQPSPIAPAMRSSALRST